MSTYPYTAKRRIEALIKSLETLVASDPEQQVQGFAFPVVAAALDDIKQAVPHDPVVRALADLISADVIGSGDPVRAADMLVTAGQINAAIGRRPMFVA